MDSVNLLAALFLATLFLAINLQEVNSISEFVKQKLNLSKKLFKKVRGKEFYQGNIREFLAQPGPQQNWTQPQNFTQCLDHFSGSCSETFIQRYWTTDEYYAPDGPIFFYLGNEAPLDGIFDGGWAWVDDYGKYHNAHLVALEHRFYGLSFPSYDTSYDTLKHLTSQQAIEDFAFFIKSFKEGNPHLKDAQVVVFGGSYGGVLATWFRTIHPKLVNVAVASSAPLESRYDNQGYTRVVSSVIKASQPNSTCYNNVKTIFKCMEHIVNKKVCSTTSVTDGDGLAAATGYVCGGYDFSVESNKQDFFQYQAFIWSDNLPATLANTLCPILNQAMAEESDTITGYRNFLLNSNQTIQSCNKKRRRQSQATKALEESSGGTSWTWQTCNEFGTFQTADLEQQVFGYDFHELPEISTCMTSFPDANYTTGSVLQNVHDTNANYGGKAVAMDNSCVVYVAGDWDPWSLQGVLSDEDVSPNNTFVLIKNGQHWSDMWTPPHNNPNVAPAQQKIRDSIGYYLKNKC